MGMSSGAGPQKEIRKKGKKRRKSWWRRRTAQRKTDEKRVPGVTRGRDCKKNEMGKAETSTMLPGGLPKKTAATKNGLHRNAGS